MIDTHLHLVDFLQHPMTSDELQAIVRANGDGAVVFGLPVKKKWSMTEPQRPTYYLDDNAPCSTYPLTDVLVSDLVTEARRTLPEGDADLLAPTICGFDPTDRLAAEHVEHMIGRYDGWRGVGEILLRHDDLTEITYGENARAGHPALDDVLDICAQRGWPFTFHQDASSAGRSGQREYVGEVEAMLDRHPGVPMVWAHAGSSRRIAPDGHARLLGELFDAHPALHADLSWVILDRLVGRPAAAAPPPALPDGWRRLLQRHPDRVVLGSDAFGSADGLAASIEQRERLLDQLPLRDRELVGCRNARRLWWGD